MGRPRSHIPRLNRRENGVWYVNWYDEKARQTRRRSLNTDDRKRAIVGYANFLLAWLGDSEQPNPHRLKAVLSFYIEHRIARGANDKERAGHAAKPLIKHFGNCELRAVDVSACHTYIDARRGKKIADGTIRRELYVIQAAANYALKHKEITQADMPTIDAPADSPARRGFLTHEEFERVYKEAKGPLQDFIALAYSTGARRRSLEALTVGQVDLHHGLIDLMPADATAQQRQSKKRNPVVPIVADIRDRLAKLIAGKAPADKVLPPRDYYLRFKEHLQSLDLEEKSYPHVLRHTRATHLLQAGVSIYDVAKLLGDTVATVEKSYGHHSSDYLANSLRGKGPKLD